MAENKNAQQVREITDKLEQGIKELFESERFKEYLRTMSKFYNYSFNNTLLIAMQKPEATYVAGYTSWQRNFDRQVMKGEKGIKILAPAPYKAQEEREKIDPATQKPVIGADGKAVTETVEVLRPAFKVVSVFDVSQTDGKELPDIIVDELKGTVENYEAFFDALKQESPVPISFEDIPGGAKGFFSPVNIKKVHAYGVEIRADLAAALTRELKINLNGTFSWAPSINEGEPMSPADRSVGKQLPYEPEYSATATGRLSWRSWGLLYQFCYYSERYTMSSNDITLTGRLTPYLMSNLSLEKGLSLRWADLTLKGTVNNLFNEEYLSVLSRPMPRMNAEFFIGIKPKWGTKKR